MSEQTIVRGDPLLLLRGALQLGECVVRAADRLRVHRAEMLIAQARTKAAVAQFTAAEDDFLHVQGEFAGALQELRLGGKVAT